MQKLLSHVRRCVQDYDMIHSGDRVAVGISGGKDSLATLCVMKALSRFYPEKFEVEAISIDMGFPDADYDPIRALCEKIDVPYTVIPTQIYELVFDVRKESNPCSLCANMRRGALNRAAAARGCNKVALGHHRDDAIETLILSLFYEGRISCFQPVTYLDRSGITLLRPMLYLPEREIAGFAKRENLPVMPRLCPQDGNSKRAEVKALIETQRKLNPDLPELLFGAIQRSAIPGWEKTEWEKDWKKGKKDDADVKTDAETHE